MPELPEVETVRRGLAPVMEGQQVLRLELNRPNLRFPFPDRFVQRIEGTQIIKMGRRAKFLVADLSTDEALIMHLGMSGRFTVTNKKIGQFHANPNTKPSHDHVIFHMQSGAKITYNDPRRFGFMQLWPKPQIATYPGFIKLGPEPLTNRFSAAYLDEALMGKTAPVKAALLDQNIVAGLGNIYVCEALFRARISPRRKALTLIGARNARLAPAINKVICDAINAGGSSISDFTSANGQLGYFQKQFSVYGREGLPCEICRTPIKRLAQSGRSSFYCEQCQK